MKSLLPLFKLATSLSLMQFLQLPQACGIPECFISVSACAFDMHDQLSLINPEI